MPALDYEKAIKFTGNWYFEFYKEKANMLYLTFSQITEYEKFARVKGIEWARDT